MLCRLLFLLLSIDICVAQSPGHAMVSKEREVKPIFPYNIDLRDKDGKMINSSKLFKKSKEPVVLLFWLTTCGPCKLELKTISEKFTSWQKQKKFSLYAISTDFPEREQQFVSRVKESNWPFMAYYDFRREFSKVMPGELNGLPQVFVIDNNGKIVYHHRKFIPGDEEALFEAIKKI